MHRFVAVVLAVLFVTPATPAFADGELASRPGPLSMQVIAPPAFHVVPGTASRQVVIVVARPPFPLPPGVYPPYRTPASPFTPTQGKVAAGVLVTIAFVGLLVRKR
jgi:hypothetical protein